MADDQELKKKVRHDDVFSKMSAPEMAASSKPVIYQEIPQPVQNSEEAQKRSAESAKKV